jgi:hypothetical protein
MNITSLADLQALLDQGYRMTFYKEENDPSTPEPGPYRLMVFKWPRSKDIPDHVIASGETMEALAADVAWVTDFDALLQIAETSPGQIRFDPPK